MNRIDIHTDRLHIRHYKSEDLDNRYDLTTRAFGIDTTKSAIQSWLDWTIKNYQALAELGQPPYGDYAIALSDTDVVIGSVGIVPSAVPWGVLNGQSPDEHHYLVSPEFGLYWGILPDYQQQGYATEAGQAIINYLFNAMYARQVVATTEHENIPSQKTMEKLGMKLYRNPTSEPFWCEVVGLLENPNLAKISK